MDALPTHVLLIEDEPAVARAIAATLVRLGYCVAGCASTGDEALEKASSLKPDLVLMDVQLRGRIDGIRAAELIRERTDTPVVFLTAAFDRETLARAMGTDPVGYLVKPFRPEELACAVEVALARHRKELLYRSASLTDELTGLSNRRGFFALANHQLKVSRRYRKPMALVFADLDGLKRINDEQGHVAGDRAIQDAARVLRQTFREPDVVGRLGGDELVVLALGADQSGAECALARLRDQLALESISMSLGYAVHDPQRGESIEDLVQRADAAMYADKYSKSSCRHTAANQGLLAVS